MGDLPDMQIGLTIEPDQNHRQPAFVGKKKTQDALANVKLLPPCERFIGLFVLQASDLVELLIHLRCNSFPSCNLSSATSLSDRAASSSIDESSRFFTSRLTFAVTASCSQLGTSCELRREKNQRTPIRLNVASGQGSKTNLWHDGPNVREPKPRRDVDEGHNGCGARRNGPRPKSRSPEPRNSLGQEEAAPLPRSELEARFECIRARWMKFALL